MVHDHDTDPNSAAAREPLLSMKSVSLVALPWLLHNKRVLEKVKNINSQPSLLGSFFQAAAASRLGLTMIIKKRRLGKILSELSNSNSGVAEQFKQTVMNKANRFSSNSNEFLESYEKLLDAAIKELEDKRKGGLDSSAAGSEHSS